MGSLLWETWRGGRERERELAKLFTPFKARAEKEEPETEDGKVFWNQHMHYTLVVRISILEGFAARLLDDAWALYIGSNKNNRLYARKDFDCYHQGGTQE